MLCSAVCLSIVRSRWVSSSKGFCLNSSNRTQSNLETSMGKLKNCKRKKKHNQGSNNSWARKPWNFLVLWLSMLLMARLTAKSKRSCCKIKSRYCHDRLWPWSTQRVRIRWSRLWATYFKRLLSTMRLFGCRAWGCQSRKSLTTILINLWWCKKRSTKSLIMRATTSRERIRLFWTQNFLMNCQKSYCHSPMWMISLKKQF